MKTTNMETASGMNTETIIVDEVTSIGIVCSNELGRGNELNDIIGGNALNLCGEE